MSRLLEKSTLFAEDDSLDEDPTTVLRTQVSGTSPRLRSIRIGLLGCGNVGSAVVRAIHAHQSVAARRGQRWELVAVLVRDTKKVDGTAGENVRVLTDADLFFRQSFDVVVEVLGGIEPARTHVERALRSGIDVVTANKSLIATHGPELERIAAENGCALRYEASTVAGVPFLMLLKRRPFAASIRRVGGILNGTSNFVLSRIGETGCTLTDAVDEARRRGLAEPDATNDLSGRDAAAKLTIILQQLGVQGIRPEELETGGIESIEPADIARARTLGGTVKPVVFASVGRQSVDAFVGPAFVPASHPLYCIDNEQNAVCLSGGIGGALTLAGPGAGPDVTAATILDDVVDLVESPLSSANFASRSNEAGTWHVNDPATGWFLRVSLRDTHAPFSAVSEALNRLGIATRELVGAPRGESDRRVYLKTISCRREELYRALRQVEKRLNCVTFAIRIAPDAV